MLELIKEKDMKAPKTGTELLDKIRREFGDPHERMTAQIQLDQLRQTGQVHQYVVEHRILMVKTGYGEAKAYTDLLRAARIDSFKMLRHFPIAQTLEEWYSIATIMQHQKELEGSFRRSEPEPTAAGAGRWKNSMLRRTRNPKIAGAGQELSQKKEQETVVVIRANNMDKKIQGIIRMEAHSRGQKKLSTKESIQITNKLRKEMKKEKVPKSRPQQRLTSRVTKEIDIDAKTPTVAGADREQNKESERKWKNSRLQKPSLYMDT